MNTPQHTQLPVAQLWQMPPEQLRLYASVANKLARLREQIDRAAACDGPRAAQDKSRRPRRRPRSGSLREAVHAVLAQAAPASLDRKELTMRTAIRRGVPPDAKLAEAIRVMLRDCEHDTGIRRLPDGTFAAGLEAQS
jgi:hypothetical protein